jgi:K+/H+ antiporter YhaU regulatory subunit KhtT
MEGISVKEGIRRINGGHILAIKKKSGHLITNPSHETLLEAGDELVLMGTRDQLNGIESLT